MPDLDLEPKKPEPEKPEYSDTVPKTLLRMAMGLLMGLGFWWVKFRH